MIRAEIIAWVCALIGLVGAMVGWLTAPDVFAAAWLSALVTWLLWPLGAVALVLAHSLTGGRWGEAARPGLLCGMATLPLAVPGLLPVLLLMSRLYHWARSEEIGHLKNGAYLNPRFFMIRMVVYLVIWLLITLVTGRHARRRQDVGGFAAPALILLAVTFTFASIDFTLSLEDFNSNIYSMIRAASAAILALSIAMLVAPVTPTIRADLAKLLLALIVLWAYLDFMQLLIVWQSNLATDAGWYVYRTTPYWGAVATVVEVMRLAIPFLILVFPQCQRNYSIVACVCVLLIATTILRSWWLVLPAFGRPIGLIDVTCMLGLGGLASGIAFRSSRLGVHEKALSHV